MSTSIAIRSGATEAIAIGRVRCGRMQYEAGQTLTLDRRELHALVSRDEAWIPAPADWWSARGRVLTVEPGTPAPCAIAPSPGSLRIAQGCAYDPGNAVYRYHSAFNEHTKHSSAFIRFGGSNPHQCPLHIDGKADLERARRFVYSADVVHHHVDYYLSNAGMGPRPRRGQLLIRHYHGSVPGGAEKQHAIVHRRRDDLLGAELLGARLTLCALRPNRMHWLPIPVPVARYAAMRPTERRRGPFRIAHSPTRAAYKGTQTFLEVCDRLNARGLSVEPVLIGMTRELTSDPKTHAEALRMKADCDAVFDSFWLGIQGSGLEGGAMGLPVIAGDPDVAGLYVDAIGHVPYTWANDARALEGMIERMILERDFYEQEATRVSSYVRRYHDYPRVAERYEQILCQALGRSDVRTIAA